MTTGRRAARRRQRPVEVRPPRPLVAAGAKRSGHRRRHAGPRSLPPVDRQQRLCVLWRRLHRRVEVVRVPGVVNLFLFRRLYHFGDAIHSPRKRGRAAPGELIDRG